MLEKVIGEELMKKLLNLTRVDQACQQDNESRDYEGQKRLFEKKVRHFSLSNKNDDKSFYEPKRELKKK